MREQTTKVNEIKARQHMFAAITLVVFTFSSIGLFAIDFVPESPSAAASERATEASVRAEALVTDALDDATPVRVIIEEIGVDTVILNPESQDAKILDEALLEGVVRYPGSGSLDEERNMLLFGHSSYLPIVHNKAYTAFNGLQDLEPGDIIRVRSASKEHLYSVTSMREASAGDVTVDFETGVKKLTLSTCDSFGDKSDRFVVEADYVGSIDL